MYPTKSSHTVHEHELLNNNDRALRLPGLGKPVANHLSSWKDYLAILACLVSLMVGLVVVFEPSVAVYFGQTKQFIWIGLCLTIMAWCAQLPLRRFFLIASLNSQASTLQSMDAILRSDPTTLQADIRVRVALTLMLALSPVLSIAYKALGGGQSEHLKGDAIGQFGLTGPPGTQNIGYGLSQFVNATQPWFKDPGFPNRVYGFNMHVLTEHITAMLDGPMPQYVRDLQGSMGPTHSTLITADVNAIVCEERAQLTHNAEHFIELYNAPANNLSSPSSSEQWVYRNTLHIGLLMPVQADNSNLVISSWDNNLNESFGASLRQYTLSRQKYTASWRVSRSSVELVSASPQHEKVDERCLLTDNWVSLADLYTRMLAEFDWRFRDQTGFTSKVANNSEMYSEGVKSDSSMLASMVWSRLTAAFGPEVWGPHDAIGAYGPRECASEGWPELRYNAPVVEKTTTMTIRPGWGIILVLALYPTALLASLLWRVLVWPRTPVGEGFGLISLMASVDKRCLGLLEGASLSGKLRRPVFVGFWVGRGDIGFDEAETQKVKTSLATQRLESESLKRRAIYN